MSESEVIYTPDRDHVCEPNWCRGELDPETGLTFMEPTGREWARSGTVIRCECGRLLVAVRPYSNIFTASWQKANWRERRRYRRLNREANE